MKERPILFSGPMVRAVLDGRKTQTRRVVTPQPSGHHWEAQPGYRLVCNGPHLNHDGRYFYNFHHYIPQNPGWDEAGTTLCPYGSPGLNLWVRETFADVNDHGVEAIAYRADGCIEDVPKDENFEFIPPVPKNWWFAAWAHDLISGDEKGWRPAIHMPRWASRINLKIENVRIERLQGIDAIDAQAEGCGFYPGSRDKQQSMDDEIIDQFKALWDSINGKKHPWSSNPWVWVVEFKPWPLNINS